jgi:hypothetical protein
MGIGVEEGLMTPYASKSYQWAMRLVHIVHHMQSILEVPFGLTSLAEVTAIY